MKLHHDISVTYIMKLMFFGALLLVTAMLVVVLTRSLLTRGTEKILTSPSPPSVPYRTIELRVRQDGG